MEIKDYPNYLIYDDGKVWSKKRKIFLKESINNGYKTVYLSKNDKRKKFRVHRLVAFHYIPNPKNKPCIDHINRIKNDNRVENLRWVTHQENCLNRERKKDDKTTFVDNNIYRKSNKSFYVNITRNNLKYHKRCKTLDEAIIQRDLMLSMFQ